MQNTTKKLQTRIKVLSSSFTGGNITNYSGINVVSRFLKSRNLDKSLNNLFPTFKFSATKSSITQVLLLIILSSVAGINRLSRISNFSQDPLIKLNLGLSRAINETKLSFVLKLLGQKGARKLESYFLNLASNYLKKSDLKSITLDADSTVSMVYGNQSGAAKGYNSIKKGAKSYHPLLVFVSELKLLYNSWFRTGSAYTSNGITEFLKQVKSSLPQTIKSVFFRADSGFFGGELFDLLEDFGWDYLVKVKLKNLNKLLSNQTFTDVQGQSGVSICEFDYSSGSWNGKIRKLKAIRTVKEYILSEFMGEQELIPIYQYACYISSYQDKDAIELHKIYKKRSESETWIEQVKSQLFAGKTLTNDFWANDILWQLATFAYNISIMMRNKHKIIRKQEHKTFRDWFILLPAKVVKSARKVSLKIYQNYYCKGNWIEFDEFLTKI